METRSEILQQLLHLSHCLGQPTRSWAILGEGNTSARLSADTFLVKASGSELLTLTEEKLVEVRFEPLLAALGSSEALSDSHTRDLLVSSSLDPGRTPSVETLFHAALLGLDGVHFIGHTHVESINSLLCSEAGWETLQQGGRLFPDEIVVCGVAPCCVPYVDPGLPLARAIVDRVDKFIDTYHSAPKTIYLQNHGFIALGRNAREVESITQMADKAARILLGAIACGRPTFLTPENVARIATRPDEHVRQRALGLTAGSPSETY